MVAISLAVGITTFAVFQAETIRLSSFLLFRPHNR